MTLHWVFDFENLIEGLSIISKGEVIVLNKWVFIGMFIDVEVGTMNFFSLLDAILGHNLFIIIEFLSIELASDFDGRSITNKG